LALRPPGARFPSEETAATVPEGEPTDEAGLGPPGAAPSPEAGEAAAPRSWKRVLFAAVKWLLFTAVLVLVARALVNRFAEVSWSEIVFRPAWLAGAAGVLLLAIAGAFLPIYLLLRQFGHRVPAVQVMASVWVAQLGKYLPGKVGTVVGVAWLLRRYKVPVAVSAGSAVMCDGLSAILSMLIALPLTLTEPIRSALPLAWLWCLVLAGAGLACLHPRVFGRLCNAVLRRLGKPPLARLPKFRDFGPVMLVLAAQYLVAGTSLWMLARSFADVRADTLPMLIGGGALAALVSLLSFFAPGGLGVYEGLLIAVVSPYLGGGDAAILAVANRFVRTVCEAFLAAGGLVVLRVARAPEPQAGPAANPPD